MHLSGIDANLLIALDALLAEASVTRAARRVGLTQSAMSHALGRLRDHLGDPILVRAGRGMVRTARAETLAPRVREVIQAMESIFVADDVFDPGSLRRRFRVAATDHAELLLLPVLDEILSSEAPGVDLLFTPIAPDTDVLLRRGELDVAIGVFPDVPSDIHQQALFVDRFVCVMRAGHPAACRPLSAEVYASLPHVLVAPRGAPGGIVDQQLRERGLGRRVARQVPHFLVAPFVVASGDYVLTLSERLARRFAELVDLDIVTPPVPLDPYTIAQAWHRRSHDDLAQRWLRDALVRAASALPPLGDAAS